MIGFAVDAKSAIFQLQHEENMLHFHEMMMMVSAL